MNILKQTVMAALSAGLMMSCSQGNDVPLVFASENTASSYDAPELPSLDELEVVDRFLLGKDVQTDVRTAPMFEDVDVNKWINW